MTLEETIEKVDKMIKNEVEIISELTYGFQIDMHETIIFKEHEALAREYMYIKMFLKKLQNMTDKQKSFDTEICEIASKNEKFAEGLADIVQACMRHKRKEAHIELNFESDDGEYAPVKVTILIEE